MSIDSRFSVDPGGVQLDPVNAQRQIDIDALANLLFEVPDLQERSEERWRNVVFDEFWWVEATVTGDNELVSLALLASAAHIGRGALRASLTRVDDAHSSGTHWRVSIDASSVTGPPNRLPRNSPSREREVSRDGATVEITRGHDGTVEHIDLWLPIADGSASVDV